MALLFVAKLREEKEKISMSTPEAAAKGLAHLVLDPALEHTTGKYFEGMNERASSQESYDHYKAAELWEASTELVQLQPSETILQVNSSLKERQHMTKVMPGRYTA